MEKNKDEDGDGKNQVSHPATMCHCSTSHHRVPTSRSLLNGHGRATAILHPTLQPGPVAFMTAFVVNCFLSSTEYSLSGCWLQCTGLALHTGMNTKAASTRILGKGKGQAQIRHQTIRIPPEEH
ncbi:hypothetical protein STEG23_003763 [Scotinomys teguina]